VVRFGLANRGGEFSCSSRSGGSGVRVSARPDIFASEFRHRLASNEIENPVSSINYLWPSNQYSRSPLDNDCWGRYSVDKGTLVCKSSVTPPRLFLCLLDRMPRDN
jgi:hypothetical protein